MSYCGRAKLGKIGRDHNQKWPKSQLVHNDRFLAVEQRLWWTSLFLFFDHFLRSQRGQDNKYMEETVWRLESGSTFQQLASHHQQGQNAACLLFHWRRSSWYQYKLLWIMESIRIYKKSENLFDKLLNCYRHGCISLAGSISSLSHKSFISRRPIKPLQKHCVIKRPLWRCS